MSNIKHDYDSEFDPYSPSYGATTTSNNVSPSSPTTTTNTTTNSPLISPPTQGVLNNSNGSIINHHQGMSQQQFIEDMFDRIDLFGEDVVQQLHINNNQNNNNDQDNAILNNNRLIIIDDFDQLVNISNKRSSTINQNNNNNQRGQEININFNDQKFDERIFDQLVEQLKETTLLHGEIQSEKVINENNIRGLYRQLWMAAEDVQVVSETCPCGSNVSHTVRCQVSKLNKEVAKKLEGLLTQNHHFNTSQFVGSLFAQSLNELRVIIYIYKCLDASRRDNGSVDISLESMILERLVNAYRANRPPPAVLNLLQHLSYRLKEHLQTGQDELLQHGGGGGGQPHQPQLIDNIDDEFDDARYEANARHSQEWRPFTSLMSDVTFNFNQEFVDWGHILMHPTIEDVFERDWLIQLFHIPALTAAANSRTTPTIKYLTENSYVSLLLQLDFSRLQHLSQTQSQLLQDKVLFPLQKALELSVTLKMMKLSLTICKLLSLISYYFPMEIEKCLGILFKSVWPVQLIASTCMQGFNWQMVPIDSLGLVFMDVYQLTTLPHDYYKQPDQSKHTARFQFYHTLVNYQFIVNEIYTIDSKLATVNTNTRFPQLAVLRRLAHKSVDGHGNALLHDGGVAFHLSRVIFDEMFYLAFVFKPPYQQQVPVTLVQQFRTELFSQMHVLLQSHPHLANRFAYNLAQVLVSVDTEALTLFLDPPGSRSPLYFWDLSGDGINWLAFIVSQRLLPTIPDIEFVNMSRQLVKQFVIDAPPYEMASQHATLASSIVYRMLMAVNWHRATPVGRLKVIYLLTSSRRLIGNWIPMFINTSRLFTNADFGAMLQQQLREIAEVNPKIVYFPNDNGMLLFLQLMCHINLTAAIEHPSHIAPTAIYQQVMGRIQHCLSLNLFNFEVLSCLLCVLVYLARDRLNLYMKDIVQVYHRITQNKQQYSPNLNILIIFIKPWFCQPIDNYPLFISSWIKILKSNMFDEENLTLLNYISCGGYLKNYGVEIIQELENGLTFTEVKSVYKSLERRPWIAYMILIAYVNQQKRMVSSPQQTKLKDSLSILKEWALELKTSNISLLFWEQFWILYFEMIISQQQDPMNTDNKNHLYSTIQSFMQKHPMTPPIKKIFETFTTWNKFSILSHNGERFITPSNVELFKTFITNAMWVFARQEDRQQQEVNQKKWLASFYTPIEAHQLLDQLLAASSRPNVDQYGQEEKKFKSFVDYLQSTSKSIATSSSGEFEAIRLFNDLKLYLGHSKRLSNDILQDDKIFLDQSQQLHIINSTVQNVLLKCTNVCVGITTSYNQKRSSPNVSVSTQIQENRKMFNQHFCNLFERIYQLSVIACVLEEERFMNLLFRGRERDLFHFIVNLVQEHHSDSVVTKLINTLKETAIIIGKGILERDPSNQQFLLDTFIKKNHNNNNNDRNESNIQNDQLSSSTCDDFTIFIKLFSPSIIVNITSYLDCLQQCLETPMNTKDKREVIDLFKVDQRIPNIFQSPGGKEQLYNLLPLLLQLPIIESTISIINSFLFIDSSHLINVTLLLVKNRASVEVMEGVYGKTRPFHEFLKKLQDPDQQQVVVQTLIESITDVKSASALFLLSHIVFYEFLSKTFLQTMLAKIRLIYIQSIRPSDTMATTPQSRDNRVVTLSDQEFQLSLDFFVNITLLIPRAVNMVWEVFYYGYMPMLDHIGAQGMAGISDKHTQALVDLIGNLAIDGHMSVATFHVQTNDVLEQMCHVICQTLYSDVVVAIFSIVDWQLLYAMPRIPDTVALHYLKLSMYMSVMNGRSITAPENGLSLATDGSLDWYKCGDLADASVVFDGTTFTSIITCPTLKRNPSQSISDCLTLFKDITLFLDNYSLAIALSLEIRSLLYFVISNESNNQYWYLPFVDQLSMIQNLLLPLIRSLAENKAAKDQEQSGTQQRMKSLLKITMSCLEFPSRFVPLTCPLLYGTLTSIDEQGYTDLSTKVQRLIMTFCSSLSMNLCLQIMPIAHIVLQGTNYCLVIESVLHSFLNEDQGQVSTLINKYLVFTDPHHIIEKSIQNSCPLLLYIVTLQQLRTNTLDYAYFLDNICTIPCTSNREYELWLIWVLIIKMVKNNHINLKNKQMLQKINNIKSWIQSYFGNNNAIQSLFNKNKAMLPQTHLASRACSVFLQRTIIQKLGKSKEDEHLLDNLLTELTKKKNGGSYNTFNEFFDQMDNLVSPILEIDDFSIIIIQTLIPFANYLCNILKYDP